MSPSETRPGPAVEASPTRVPEDFLGYVVRRSSMAITERFQARMQRHGLRPLTFTVLLLIRGQPGITSSQLCSLLDLQSSNVVGLIRELESRGLVGRQDHPLDRRAWGLRLQPEGEDLLAAAEPDACAADEEAMPHLTPAELSTLRHLMCKGLGLAGRQAP